VIREWCIFHGHIPAFTAKRLANCFSIYTRSFEFCQYAEGFIKGPWWPFRDKTIRICGDLLERFGILDCFPGINPVWAILDFDLIIV